ncbi:hypothetical protein HHI36_010009 [Cryptolaemus montrouzieri]|uniref:Uncharacterized protein n=1 Tax=Cryptolaemus montrouzieri TaxID=559131 RepID=A0ABD2MI65_9CUCU
MYTLIFFSILCGVFYPIDGQNQDSQAMMAKVTSVLQKCSEETGATPNVITKIKLKQPVTTRQEKCMLFCTYRELKLQTPDGEFSLDVAISNLRNVAIEDSKLLDKLVEVYTKCSKIPFIEDPCEYATAIAICGITEAEKMGIDTSLLQ